LVDVARWCWQQVQAWLSLYQLRGVMAPEAAEVVQGWIEAQVSQYGADLCRDDACQELWVFVLEEVIPKLSVKLGNWHFFILLRIRQQVDKIGKRQAKIARELSNLEGIYNGTLQDHRHGQVDAQGQRRLGRRHHSED
jgi:hypothetical protein